MTFVIDASVAVKWFFQNKPGEHDVNQALTILKGLQHGQITALQPAHWIVEVMSVVAREAFPFADEALETPTALDLPVSTDPSLYKKASKLSDQLKHHMFDTLYHALSIENGATLITADDAYFAKAYRFGNVSLLLNFRMI